jgi:hypothetical protein
MSKSVDLEVFCRDGSFLIVAPEFGVVARANDISAGVQDALQKVETVERLYREAGVEPVRRPPRTAKTQSATRWGDSIPPAVVSGLIMSALVFLASIPLVSASTKLSSMVENLALVGGVPNAEQLSRGALNSFVTLGASMEKVTPQRKEELRVAARRIMNGLAPVLEEVGAVCTLRSQPGAEPIP